MDDVAPHGQDLREVLEGILVIVDQECSQGPVWSGRARVSVVDAAPLGLAERPQAARGRGADRGHFEGEGGAEPRAGTGRREAAAVLLDDRAADRQAQPQAAEPARRRRPPLLQDVEDPGKSLRLDADAGVADLDRSGRHAVRSVRVPLAIAGPDRDPASGGGELDRVLDQVPEDLLEPDRVGVDVVAAAARSSDELEPRARKIVAADLDDVMDQLVGVDRPRA